MSDVHLSRRSLLSSSLLVGGGVLGASSLASAADPSTIKILNSFAELEKTPANVGDIAYVKGYSTAGVGGGEFIAQDGLFTEDKGTISKSYSANGVTAPYWLRLNTEVVTPFMFGAKGNGSDDDQDAIQAAIDFVCSKKGSELYFPAPIDAYIIKKSLVIRSPLKITGAGANKVHIIATGLGFGEYVFNFDCAASPDNYFFEMSDITIRSNNSKATGIRLRNTAYVLLKNIRLYTLYDGVEICEKSWSISFEQVITYKTEHFGLFFNSNTGIGGPNKAIAGGQYSFVNCTFSGTFESGQNVPSGTGANSTGVYIDDGVQINNVSFVNCNFEKCGSNAVYVGGSVFGLSFVACRTEGCSDPVSPLATARGIELLIRPAVNQLVGGLSITGCFFSPHSGAVFPISLGGGGGLVRGFNISGNYVAVNSIDGIGFVRLNGDGESGVISGNYFNGDFMLPTDLMFKNQNRAGVRIFSNENKTKKALNL